MDKASRKRLKKQLREHERNAALRALPLPVLDLDAMFDMLRVELPLKGRDKTRRLTQAWLVSRGYDVESVFGWLDGHSGFCDCEVLANSAYELERAKASSRTPPD